MAYSEGTYRFDEAIIYQLFHGSPGFLVRWIQLWTWLVSDRPKCKTLISIIMLSHKQERSITLRILRQQSGLEFTRSSVSHAFVTLRSQAAHTGNCESRLRGRHMKHSIDVESSRLLYGENMHSETVHLLQQVTGFTIPNQSGFDREWVLTSAQGRGPSNSSQVFLGLPHMPHGLCRWNGHR